jgi:hypothetical protein
MTTKFCYRCANDTEFISGGKRCSQCGLTELQGKKFINSERRPSQTLPAKSIKVQIIQKSVFCHACNEVTQHDLQSNGNLWCNTCGRDEGAALAFSKLVNSRDEVNESYVDSALVVSIKLTLLFFLFPWSLLFLVIFYGFSGSSEIIKKLFNDVILLLVPLFLIAIFIGFLLLVMNNKV